MWPSKGTTGRFLLSTVQNRKNSVTIGGTILEENYMADEREARLQRLHALWEKGINPYPNRGERAHTITKVFQHFVEWQGEEGRLSLSERSCRLRRQGRAT